MSLSRPVGRIVLALSAIACSSAPALAGQARLCDQASSILPDLECVESANGVALASNAARAQRLLELAEGGVERFKANFGRQPLRYAVAEAAEGLVSRESVAGLRKGGFPVVLPWLSDRTYRAQVEASIRRGVSAQMVGRPQAEIDAAVQTAVDRQMSPATRARIELAAVAHELGHYWYWQGYWPNSTLSEDKHYGGPSPDWLDEMAAVLMEAPDSIDDRVKQFAQRYNRYRADPTNADENTKLMIDLNNFFSETHPAHQQVQQLNKNAGIRSSNDSFRVISGEEARKIAEGGVRFYLQSAVASQYLMERTGDRQIFARIAEAFVRGETIEQWLANAEPKGTLPRELKAMQADWLAWLDQRFPTS